AVDDADRPMEHGAQRECRRVKALLPARQVQAHALARDATKTQGELGLAALGALDELLRPAIQRCDEGVLQVGAVPRADRQTPTELVTQAPRGCTDRGQRANRGICYRNRERYRRALAVSHDPGACQVKLASRS